MRATTSCLAGARASTGAGRGDVRGRRRSADSRVIADREIRAANVGHPDVAIPAAKLQQEKLQREMVQTI